MEKIKRLNWYQKGVLIVMIAMALVFAVVYSMTISKVGFEYKNAIFVPSQENGILDNFEFSYTVGDGIERDENGNAIDPVKPSASAILELMNGPALTHKGDWSAWFGAVFLCLLNAFSVLFADELFRWNLTFQIRNADQAEPSDWEIAGRYIAWTVITIAALVIFLIGLQ
ncbi:MAG: hypothetical protein KH353_05275 [Clostridium sp.]|nr:hypothetical protein [Clostridium sp.]